ncbi:MAG: toll/interleukin-1 receptor domain-containing protein [Actinomycetota bacterium]
MARIAISYRREDSGWITGRIFDRLKNHYEDATGAAPNEEPVVFLDYDSTPVGVDFRNYIKRVFDSCDVLLAVIGPDWMGDDGTGKTRLSHADDWVRIEIETALKKNIPVIPVLIDRTKMPARDDLPEDVRDLVYRQAAVIDTEIDFNAHMERLIRQIDRLGGKPAAKAKPSGPLGLVSPPPVRAPRHTPLVYGLAAVALCAIAIAAWLFIQRERGGPESGNWTYTVYRSPDLGVTFAFPRDLLSLDTTDRKQLKLYLRDADGRPLVQILRTPLPENKDVKAGRDQEVAELKRLDYTLTYIAPELEKNWSNWYVLSGVKLGTEFYFRRWYTDDSVVSIEFIYPKEMAPIFEKLVPYMTQDFTSTSTIPKT